jgi:hypothetical protein
MTFREAHIIAMREYGFPEEEIQRRNEYADFRTGGRKLSEKCECVPGQERNLINDLKRLLKACENPNFREKIRSEVESAQSRVDSLN